MLTFKQLPSLRISYLIFIVKYLNKPIQNSYLQIPGIHSTYLADKLGIICDSAVSLTFIVVYLGMAYVVTDKYTHAYLCTVALQIRFVYMNRREPITQ